MLRRLAVLLILSSFISGCVKRIPASAGGDRTLVAGQSVSFGEETEVPEGALVVWTMGEGTELSGSRITHAWHAPGSYQVKVQVKDTDGQQREDTARIEVTRPPLLQVLPADTEVLALLHRPAQRLGDFPLFLERLLVSGKDANASLNSIRDLAGFDPFSEKGLRSAGLDPQGGVAGISRQVEGKTSFTVVYSVGDSQVAQDTVRRIWSRTIKTEEIPSKSDPAITEMRKKDKQELIAAFMLYRGHLWISPAEKEGFDPVAGLAGLKVAKGSLAESAEYKKAAATRKDLGGLHFYISRKLFQRASADKGIQAKMAKILGYLRADLDVDADGIQVDASLGLTGPEVSVLAGTLRARNAVPDFGTMIARDPHLVTKLSVDFPGLIKAVLDLSGQANAWATLSAALDQVEKSSGILARQGFLHNLGDNYLLSIRFQPMGLLEMISGAAGPKQSPEKLAKAVLYVQLKDPGLFAKTVEGITKLGPVAGHLRRVEAGKKRKWLIGPQATPLAMIVGEQFAILATSSSLADSAERRIANPESKLPDWPDVMASKDHQVVFFDVSRLLKDLIRAPVPRKNFAAQMTRSMISMTAGKLQSLGTVTLDAVLGKDTLAVHLRLNLR
jgi:hypothetical protein